MDLSHIIDENDSKIAIDSITSKIQASKEIVNIIEAINSLVENLMDVRYEHCHWMVKMLAGKVAKRAHICSHPKFVLYHY